MYKVIGTDIILKRGDTFICEVEAYTDKDMQEPYVPQEGDRIRFAMKHKFSDPEDKCVIRKEIPTPTMLLRLESSDTKALTAKAYVYDIELTKVNGEVDTFIDGSFTLKDEVD